MRPETGRSDRQAELHRLMGICNSAFWKEIVDHLSVPWAVPHGLAFSLGEILHSDGRLEPERVIVTGDNFSRCAYLVTDHYVTAISPWVPPASLPIVRETAARPVACAFLDSSIAVYHRTRKLDNRLDLPTVLLVNLCVTENFPVPRLSLGIGVVAAALRNRQLADVHLIDMQLGPTEDNVLESVLNIQPAMVGLSVSFGQKTIAFSLLESLESLLGQNHVQVLLVVGNVIPALTPGEFLKRFPRVVVAYAEGEETSAYLVGLVRGRVALHEVPGIIYRDAKGLVHKTPPAPVDMAQAPMPALDALPLLARRKGALTLELSRGCPYSRCSFCPRGNRSPIWKGVPADQVIAAFRLLVEAGARLGIPPRVFLADEEFIGNAPESSERISEVASGLMKLGADLKFDAATRVDQVYHPKHGPEWHENRLRMWHLCLKAGLSRLFLGLESGCQAQLDRMNKGITVRQNIGALRLLTALGIVPRCGFIMFDQLMLGFADVRENILFLERTDAILRPADIDALGGHRRLFELVEDDDFVAHQSEGTPILEVVSYMLASMEVLVGSHYAGRLRHAGKVCGRILVLDDIEVDTNMGRHRAVFMDPAVGEVALACQKWIDRNYALTYAIKSLHKVAPLGRRPVLMSYMRRYRKISHYLLKAMLYVVGEWPEADNSILQFLGDPSLYAHVTSIRPHPPLAPADVSQARLERVCEVFEQLVAGMIDELQAGLTPDEEPLRDVIYRWHKNRRHWQLINDPVPSRGQVCLPSQDTEHT